MSLSRRTILLYSPLIVIGVVVAVLFFTHRGPDTSMYLNTVLAVRGFRHDALEVETGQTATYTVDVGEEFKVTWKALNMSEDGQILFHGPVGIGSGIVPVHRDLEAHREDEIFALQFTGQKPGTAEFSFTTTGPGPDGTYTLTTAIVVTIKDPSQER